MKHPFRIAGVALLIALMSGPSFAADEKAYVSACAAAEEARKISAELRYEWNTIAPLMKKADEAAAAGDFGKAVKLCDEARLQSEAAIAQAKKQADVWKAAVVR